MAFLTIVTVAVCLFVSPSVGQHWSDPFSERGRIGRPDTGLEGTRDGAGGFIGLGGLRGAGGAGGTGGTGQRPSDRLSRKLPMPEDAVATSVVRTTDQYFTKPAPVGFDHIITNINGGYNRQYGVFTAPVPGIYSINYHVQTKKGSKKKLCSSSVSLIKPDRFTGLKINSAVPMSKW